MEHVMRWVCTSCGAIHFPDIAKVRGKCPTCGGQGHVRKCSEDESGVVTPLPETK